MANKLHKKGQVQGAGMGIVMLFIVITICSAVLLVSMLVSSKIKGSIDRGEFTLDQNNTITEAEETANDSFSLGFTALLVLAAVIILTSIIGMVVMFRGRG